MVLHVTWTDKSENEWIVLIKVDKFKIVKPKGMQADNPDDAAGYTVLDYSVIGLHPDGDWKPTTEQRDTAMRQAKAHDFTETLVNKYLDDEDQT